MAVIAYEMQYGDGPVAASRIVCVPMEAAYFPEYMRIYNECFYEMRRALDIQPYHFLNSWQQIAEKAGDIHLLLEQGEIIGSVACYGNEIDDLIVNPKFQHKGYGRQLLLWGMQHIREKSGGTITLHVAGWNTAALRLYQKAGFEITRQLLVGP